MNGTPGATFANLAQSAIALISIKGGEVRQIVDPVAHIKIVRRTSGGQWSSPTVVVQRGLFSEWSPDGLHLSYSAEDYPG